MMHPDYETTEIAVGWNGLPAYGARLVKAGMARLGKTFPVIGTPPAIPIEGMEEILGQKVHWVDHDSEPKWADLGLPVPKRFLATGWAHTPLNALGADVRAHGGKVAMMMDNSWKGTLRQYVGMLVYRVKMRGWHAAAMVPGRRGRRLMRRFGMPDDRIFGKLYGSEPSVFFPGPPLSQRPKQLLFVGQFIDRKGVRELVDAFRAVRDDFPDWHLRLFGSGPLAEAIKPQAQIEVRPFAQPDAIAEAMRASRALVLPSREDNWPLVVHEAACSGCALILTRHIGNSDEFACGGNGIIIDRTDTELLAGALRDFMSRDDSALDTMGAESARLAQGFGPEPWAETFLQILEAIRPS